MLEKINLDRELEKEIYKNTHDELILKLSELQRQAKENGIPIIIVFEGWDAAGKGTLINQLILPMDPRGFRVYPTNAPNEEERMRPFLWRFWKNTPAKGRIAIFDRSWYGRISIDKIDHNIKNKQVIQATEDILSFEKQLSDSGNIIIKLFLHITKKEQARRFKQLKKNKSMAWKVGKDDIKHHKQYDEYLEIYEEMLEKTDTDYAPWTIIESTDRRFATIKILKTVINSVQDKINNSQKNNHIKNNKKLISLEDIDSVILDNIDLSKDIPAELYKKSLKEYQNQLRDIEHRLFIKRIPMLILYEGWDAAGKGGNIRRLTEKMDPRGYEVVPIAAPNDVEKAHHYLWRFWNALPKAGHITIFDRTWYGRVLVERIEGFCSENDWKRAYKEINEMEKHITNFGGIVVKFWLHIDKEEQLRRFEARQVNPHKQWKITDEDWRNREKWDDYKKAVEEMIFRTSTTYSPWTIVESNSKHYARIKTLKTVIDAAEKLL